MRAHGNAANSPERRPPGRTRTSRRLANEHNIQQTGAVFLQESPPIPIPCPVQETLPLFLFATAKNSASAKTPKNAAAVAASTKLSFRSQPVTVKIRNLI